MKKVILLGVCSSVMFLNGCGFFGSGSGVNQSGVQVCLNSTCFDVEIADTPDEHVQGLQNREEMAEDAGMLFVFEKLGAHEFWMKNTLIPLDIIWLDESGEVVYVKEYAPPCPPEKSEANECQLFGPDEGVDSKYVLELNANSTRELGITPGVKMDIVGLE